MGSILAVNHIGTTFEFGVEGVREKNKDEALKYYLEAAEKGLKLGMTNLERLL